MPSISVIVPVYKVEPYICRCVDSILAQTFSDFELILVDDGSPDHCGAICDDYAERDGRVRVIHQENGGLSAARNAGIDWAFANSDSEWLTFIDSDDWICPDYLQMLLDAAIQTGTQISICGLYRTDQTTMPTISEEQKTVKTFTPEEFWSKRYVNATVACGKLYRKELFRHVRYPVGRLHEDEFTTYKVLFGETRISDVDAEMYCYYQNSDGIMRTVWRPKRLDAFDALAEQAEYFESHGFPKALLTTINVYYGNLLKTESELARVSNGKKYLRQLHRNNRRFVMKYRRVIEENWKREMLEHAFPTFFRVYHRGGDMLRALRIR